MHDSTPIEQRALGKSGLQVSPIGFGAFKIGRNEKTKYAQQYALPTDREVERLLNAILDMGINYIDTAPAYGMSESRIGVAIAHRRSEFVLSTKAGERFENGASAYDYSDGAVRGSVDESRRRLRSDVLDIVFVHSNGDDIHIQEETGVVNALARLKDRGAIKAIGFSGKTVAGARRSLAWADVIMVEYHLQDRSHEAVIAEAAKQGVGVVVKKGLVSGHLSADDAIRFVLENGHVGSLVVGGLNPAHMRENIAVASDVVNRRAAAGRPQVAAQDDKV